MKFNVWNQLLLAPFLLWTLSAQAVTGEDFNLHGYLRAGSRSSDSTTPRCYKNKGPATSINEFRLGNECEDYGELRFMMTHHPGEEDHSRYMASEAEKNAPFFQTVVSLNFAPGGYNHTEAMEPGLVEAYVTGGNLDGTQLKYWAGKRFYRDAVIYMNDDFYFASTSGNGAGVTDIEGFAGSKVAVAYFLEQTNPNPPTTGANTRYKGHYLDLRVTDITLSESNRLDFWLMGGSTPGGDLATGPTGATTTHYPSSSGLAVGLKHKFSFQGGSQNFSVQYGSGLLQSLGLANVADPVGVNLISSSSRLRLVDHVLTRLSDKVEMEFAARYETFESDSAAASGYWWSAGVRPIYFITKHFAVSTELGASDVKYDTDLSPSHLQRISAAFELRMDDKYLGRPVMRLYYSTSFEERTAVGLQAEVWF